MFQSFHVHINLEKQFQIFVYEKVIFKNLPKLPTEKKKLHVIQ